MSLVVPFDGSTLSKAALVRAAQFETVLSEPVLVIAVIPKDNAAYASERGWIDRNDPFDEAAIISHLQSIVTELAPDADFNYVFVDRHAPRGTIANRIRRFARDHDASIVFVGSENAGRIVHSITVGTSVTADSAYDTMIISDETLPEIKTLEAEISSEEVLP